jgi:hypothetical protein
VEEVQAGFGRDLPLDLLHLGGRLVVLVVRGLLLLRQCSGSRLVRIHAAGVWRCVTHKRGEERAGHRPGGALPPAAQRSGRLPHSP